MVDISISISMADDSIVLDSADDPMRSMSLLL